MAKAEGPRWDKLRMASDHPADYTRVHLQVAPGQNDPLRFDVQPPRSKQLKCRTRFRAVATYTVPSTPPAGEGRSFDHAHLAEPLRGSNKHRILPFYYIFLFRFTPF